MKKNLTLKIVTLLVFITCSHQAMKNVNFSSKEIPPYRRDEWRHWSDVDGDCQNTRAEILISRSQVKPSFRKKQCSVESGAWEDFYYPDTLTQASQADIDHVVSLKNAHNSGGYLWGAKQKEEFANDEENLVITSKKTNRQKGAKGIDEWLPVKSEYACRYINKWIVIKKKYKLRISESEQKTLNLIKGYCDVEL